MTSDPIAELIAILTTSTASGVPVADLTTIGSIYGLVGPAYEEMVTIAPHVVRGSPSWDAWYSYTWREYMEPERGRVEPNS